MTPKGADLAATDLIEVSTLEAGSYVTKSITGQELIDAIPLPPSGLTVGTTPIASGTIGRVLFQGTGNVLQQSGNLFWDSTNNRLGIGTETPSSTLHLNTTTAVYNCRIQSQSSSGANLIGTEYYWDNTQLATFSVNGPSGEFKWFLKSGYFSTFYSNALERMRIVNTGNVLINTTTDAGFRLDVNGTARVQTSLLLGSSLINVNTTAFPLQVNFTNAASNVGAIWRNGSSTGYTSFRFYNNINDGGRALEMGYSGSAYSGAIISGGITGESAYLTTTGAYPLQLGSNNVTRFIIASSGNLLVNTTTDAGFRLDVNGTARVSGNLTVLDNNQLGWGNGNYLIANNATPKIDCYVQSSLILTLGQTLFTINVASRTRDLTPSSDNSFDFGGQFGRYRHGWLSGQLKVGDATAVNASAKVQIDSTTQGFLPPRMTTTQKNAIATPATGLQVYDTTLNQMSYYNGTTWTNI